MDHVIHDFLTFNVPHIIADLLQLLILLILIEVVISYMLQFGSRILSRHPFVKFVRNVVNPLLNPVRRALPPYKTGNIDFSPMIVMIGLQILVSFLYSL